MKFGKKTLLVSALLPFWLSATRLGYNQHNFIQKDKPKLQHIMLPVITFQIIESCTNQTSNTKLSKNKHSNNKTISNKHQNKHQNKQQINQLIQQPTPDYKKDSKKNNNNPVKTLQTLTGSRRINPENITNMQVKLNGKN